MPISVHKQIDNNTTIGIWRLTEELNDIEQQANLNNNEVIQYKKITNKRRKCEWLITRILLEHLLSKKYEIYYTTHNKPYIKIKNVNISISHSKNYVGIIYSNNNKQVGIDIETIEPRVYYTKNKFLSDKELEYCNTLELMTIGWCTKEAIFKIYEKNLNFFDVEIHPFNIKNNTLQATANQNNIANTFSLQFFKIENDFIVYTR